MLCSKMYAFFYHGKMQIDFGHEDGRVVFRSGRVVHADVIVHCTGYCIVSSDFLLHELV